MKAINLNLYEKFPERVSDIKEYIKTNSFEVSEAYKNILKLLNTEKGGQIRNIQEAYRHIYKSRNTDFEMLAALDYIHGKINQEKLTLEEVLAQLGINKVPNQHPAIENQRKTIHGQIQKTAPDISEQIIEEINKSNS